MKNLSILFSLILSVFLIISCNNDDDGAQPAPGEISLDFGESKDFGNDNLTIKFDKIVEDSRCPTDAVCIWEGQAAVRLSIESGASVDSISVTLRGDNHPLIASDTINERIFTLIEVNPYPEDSGPIPFEDYDLTIMVTEL